MSEFSFLRYCVNEVSVTKAHGRTHRISTHAHTGTDILYTYASAIKIRRFLFSSSKQKNKKL